MQTKLQQHHGKQVQSFTLESMETNFFRVSKTNAKIEVAWKGVFGKVEVCKQQVALCTLHLLRSLDELPSFERNKLRE